MGALRYVQPVAPRAARGLVADVYRQVRRDFGLLRDPRGDRSPFLAHSPVPELLAGMWTVLYETMLVGAVPRADKELVGAAISARNACPFCVDAHAVLSEAAGGERVAPGLARGSLGALADPRRRELAAWAAATREPDNPVLARPPFARADVAEMVSTALAFHYINRVVLVFLGDAPVLPARARLRRPVERVLALQARGALRRAREPGRSLHLLPPAEVPADFAWAHAAPHIAAALARFSAAAERCAEPVIPSSVRTWLRGALADWDGADPAIAGDWLAARLGGIGADAEPIARVCLLVALAPYRITASDVAEFRAVRPTDRELVTVVCWSALAAARRISSWLLPHLDRREARGAGSEAFLPAAS